MEDIGYRAAIAPGNSGAVYKPTDRVRIVSALEPRAGSLIQGRGLYEKEEEDYSSRDSSLRGRVAYDLATRATGDGSYESSGGSGSSIGGASMDIRV